MEEVGVDISKEFPKPMTDEVVRAADAVITMGCGDACPIFPGKRYEDWDVEDPAGQARWRRCAVIREEIRHRVEDLIEHCPRRRPPLEPRVEGAGAMSGEAGPSP